jgi:hypothetical protein
MISRILGAHPRLIRVPRLLLDLAAGFAGKVGQWKKKGKVSFYPDLIKMLDYDWVYSSEKAKRELGYFCRPIQETLQDLLTNRFGGSYVKPIGI